MKWSVLFGARESRVVAVVAIMGSFATLFTHSVLALCVLLVAIYWLAEGSKIRTLWILGILGGLMVVMALFFNVTTVDNWRGRIR